MSRDAALGGEIPDAGTEQRPDRGEGVDECGAIVVDADAGEPFEARSRAVVVNTPPVACSDWSVYYEGGEEVTVADDNPVYDADAHVIVVAYLDDVLREYPDWDADSALAPPLECRSYAFPPRRLQRVGTYPEDVRTDAHDDERPPTPADRLTSGQEDLRDRLEESGSVAIAPDHDDAGRAVLIFEKLGTEYTIDADGVVSDGAIAGRLGNVAADYLECESE
jgi:hypothetical protein